MSDLLSPSRPRARAAARAPHVLIVSGADRKSREAHVAEYGKDPAGAYADALRLHEPDLSFDPLYPSDPDADLPAGADLAGYDAVFVSGSALHVYQPTPEVRRHLDLARGVFASGVPFFGSCFGVQVAAAAAGGTVNANPNGREAGFARSIAPSDLGRTHPLLLGRPAAYSAPALHDDVVLAPPPGSVLLAGNTTTQVQAIQIPYDGGLFWGVQYHPEFALDELAVMLLRDAESLVTDGFARDRLDVAVLAAELRALHDEPDRKDLRWRHALDAEVIDPKKRTREFGNFLLERVRPGMGARGRG